MSKLVTDIQLFINSSNLVYFAFYHFVSENIHRYFGRRGIACNGPQLENVRFFIEFVISKLRIEFLLRVIFQSVIPAWFLGDVSKSFFFN